MPNVGRLSSCSHSFSSLVPSTITPALDLTTIAEVIKVIHEYITAITIFKAHPNFEFGDYGG